MTLNVPLSVDQEMALIDKARSGDGDAYGALVQIHMKKIYTLAYQLTGQHADADDVAQNVFLKAHRHLNRFAGRSSFSTWLYRITVNEAMDHRRRRKHRLFSDATVEDSPALDPVGPDRADRAAESREQSRVLWAGLERLSVEVRAAVVMVYIEDLSPRDAAARLGCAEATVHWRLFRARRQLRNYFKEVPL